MRYEVKDKTIFFEASLEDVKLIYRTLHRHLTEHLDLMDCEFFDAIQAALQKKAQAEGVDVGHHSAWDLWLGNEGLPTCEERVKKRKTL